MHEPGGVRGGEPATCKREPLDDLGLALTLREPAAERAGIEQLLREEHEAAFDADLVDRDHVRMRDARHRLALAQHPHALLVGGGGGAQHFERDLAIELAVVRTIDHAHPALAELAGDDKPADPRAVMDVGFGIADHALTIDRRFDSCRSPTRSPRCSCLQQ